MTTAIAVYNSEGCVGRCDARCHEATSEHCTCICGGALHGVGAARAFDLRALASEQAPAALEAFAARTDRRGESLHVAYPEVQLELTL